MESRKRTASNQSCMPPVHRQLSHIHMPRYPFGIPDRCNMQTLFSCSFTRAFRNLRVSFDAIWGVPPATCKPCSVVHSYAHSFNSQSCMFFWLWNYMHMYMYIYMYIYTYIYIYVYVYIYVYSSLKSQESLRNLIVSQLEC